MAWKMRRWQKWLGGGVLSAAVLLAGAALAGKWWIIPAIARAQLARHLPEYWDGSAEIGRIDFRYFGPIVLGGVRLSDRAGRTWLDVGQVRLTLRDWPSLHPKLTGVEIDRPVLFAHVVGGRCQPPLRKIPSELWTQYVDLTSLTIRGGAVEVIDDGNPAGRWDPLHASLSRASEAFCLSLSPDGPPAVRNLTVGSFVLEDDRLELARLSGEAGGGRLVASLSAKLRSGGPLELSGSLAARSVDLAALNLAYPAARRGVATGLCRFNGVGLDPRGFQAGGTVFIEGADLRQVPIAAELLRQAGLGQLNVLSNSDVEVVFHVGGAVATFDQARVHLPLAAVDVEPGGTFDLRTGTIDLYAVVVLFEKVRGLIRSIPLVGMVADLTERLSRFRVRGKWDASDVEITPEPAGAVAEGTRKFLTGEAGGAGNVGGAALKALSDLFGPGPAEGPETRTSKGE